MCLFFLSIGYPQTAVGPRVVWFYLIWIHLHLEFYIPPSYNPNQPKSILASFARKATIDLLFR